GLIGQLVEQLAFHVVDQRREALRVAVRVADPAGKQRVPGEQVRVAPRVAVEQRYRTRGVAHQVDDLQAAFTHPYRVAVRDRAGDPGQRARVRGMGQRGRAG